MISRIHCHLNANEDFVIFLLPSSLNALLTFIYMFSVSLQEGNPNQLLFYLLRGGEHIYQNLGLQGEVYSL